MSVNNEQGSTGESSVPADSSASPEVNWADLDSGFDEGGAYVVEPEAPAEPSPSQPAPSDPSASSPSATSPAPETTAPPSSPAPAQSTAQAPAPAQAPSTQEPAATPASQAPNVEELTRQYHAQLQQEYGMTEEDALALVTDPASVMPKLAANMHMRVMQDVQRHVAMALQAVPQMIAAQQMQVQAEESAKQEFFNGWPGLSAHYDTVVQTAKMVRSMNPNATKEQIMNMTGVMSAMALGLDPAAVRVAPQTGQQGQAQQRQVPRKPAGVVSAPSAAPQGSQNIFSDFAAEDINWMKG